MGKEVNGKLTEGFLYDGQLQPIAEMDAAGQIVEQFVYGTRPNVPDYIIKGGVVYRVISNQVGSPVLIVDASTGAVVQQLRYDAWGNVTQDTNPGFQPFGFAGGLYDPLTHLVHFGARDYDAATGTWLQPDPVLFQGGSSNLYSYVLDDPVDRMDPSGQDPVSAIAGTAIGIGFGLVNGYLNGDRGSQLVHDALIDGLAGGVAGLLDDPAAAVAVERDLIAATLDTGLSVGVNTSAEIARQELNYGCVRSLTDVAAAAIGGLGAHAATSADDAGRAVQSLDQTTAVNLHRLDFTEGHVLAGAGGALRITLSSQAGGGP